MKSMRMDWRGRTAVLGTLVAVGISGCGGGGQAQPSPTPYAWGGATITHALREPDLHLTDTSGAVFPLRKAEQGKLVLLYFGYTHCPDVCPLTMANQKAMLNRLTPEQRTRVSVIFVTTDPKRDTGVALRAFLDNYDPAFIGLTGSAAQTDAAQQAAGVSVATEEPDPKLGYTVSHAAYVIAYTPDGLAHIVFPDGVTVADETRDVQRLLTRGFIS